MNYTAPVVTSKLTAAEAEHAHVVRTSGLEPEEVETTGATGLPTVDDPAKVAPKDARALTKTFLDRLTELEEGTHEYQYVRNTLIELNLSLVRYAARRFHNRAVEMEDIVQVGTIGLIKAIDRFDLSREVEFTTFAVPYIVGEIKRFFRDTSWAVHVPRRLQELRIDLAKANEELFQRLDRSPTTAELAEHLRLTEDEVIDGLVASNGYLTTSLDAPADQESGATRVTTYADRFGDVDPAMEAVENLQALKPLVEQLGERDRRILQLRFGEEMTQSEIGAELGVSQMHVSRLLSRALGRLRRGMLAE
ncbi:RNA polymerase sigma factor SigF [Streptomyces hygroscopicus]|uniref:RNA polymerase sigma-B factor n=2 Tax=Streptomyces TaxID=1883 RepID=A0ABT9KKP4_9ACTN|nr:MULTISPECIES: RNA polymerase sigma factor SigF [Streptomyces]MDN3053225.1 RNA polymerase sigma factor SigF [Streptomyces sp. SRF1]MDP9608996.1 RNA polymerase sigma-B factor [Streptomyces demainii]GHJ27203.1 RNA polymerase sigma factor [Streptomyces hygroscopicus]GLV74955.1 RNA polymerase sigma factor [Streptomyces hygroscopicus subsp. hygroscopicus]